MSSSNSFNICPKCGSPNAMSAKYCSRCGGELRLPEEPVVCQNCRTRNSPLANFCRNCGAELKVGYATKICARCGSEVPADQNVCTCGYVFAHTGTAAPIPVRSDSSVDAAGGADTTTEEVVSDKSADKKNKKEKVKKDKSSKSKDGKVYSNKGGRAFAIVALVLLVVCAYLIVAPYNLRPAFLSQYDSGISIGHAMPGETGEVPTVMDNPWYGYDVIMLIVNAVMSGSFVDTINANGGVGQLVLASLATVFALVALIHLIVCIVRIFTSKRSKRPNWLFLVLAVLSSIIVGLVVVFNMISVDGVFAIVAKVFQLADGWFLGYVIYAIPAYFWLFFFYSLIAKARVLKEETITHVEAVEPTTTA